MTYCSFLKVHGFTETEVSSNFMQCFFIFMLQAILSFFIFKELGGKKTDGISLLQQPTDTDMLSVRFICSILLHIQLEGEIRRSLGMIKHFNNHHETQFSATASYGPFFIAVMQLLGCLFAETLNVWLVCR